MWASRDTRVAKAYFDYFAYCKWQRLLRSGYKGFQYVGVASESSSQGLNSRSIVKPSKVRFCGPTCIVEAMFKTRRRCPTDYFFVPTTQTNVPTTNLKTSLGFVVLSGACQGVPLQERARMALRAAMFHEPPQEGSARVSFGWDGP